MEEYLVKLEDKLVDKGLDEFWVVTDREDFKPIKKDSKDVKKMLKEKAQYYREKKIAKISLCVSKNGLVKSDWVLAVTITVFTIHDDGSIDTNRGDGWSLKVRYLADDLHVKKFTLKDAERMMRFAANRDITSDSLAGMSYEKYKKMAKKVEKRHNEVEK